MCRRILQLEEEMVQEMCSDVLRVKPDLVITEKGVSDLAQHFLMKAGVSVIRRVRKSDNNRIARYSRLLCDFTWTSVNLLCLLQSFSLIPGLTNGLQVFTYSINSVLPWHFSFCFAFLDFVGKY